LRRIRVVVVSVLLMLALAATMAALPAFAGGGETDEGNDKNGFGTAASQIATNNGGLGEHSSDPDGDGKKGEKREGIGNVARDEDPDGDGHVADHGCGQLAAMGGDCKEGPGKGK
jgi:hypothetical protein